MPLIRRLIEGRSLLPFVGKNATPFDLLSRDLVRFSPFVGMEGKLFAAFEKPDTLIFLADPVPLVGVDLKFAERDGSGQLAGFEEFPGGDIAEIGRVKDMSFLVDERKVVEVQDEDPALVIF